MIGFHGNQAMGESSSRARVGRILPVWHSDKRTGSDPDLAPSSELIEGI